MRVAWVGAGRGRALRRMLGMQLELGVAKGSEFAPKQ